MELKFKAETSGKEVVYGKVKWYSKNKGYGFIKGYDGCDYFVCYEDFYRHGGEPLHKGEFVIFNPVFVNDKNRVENLSIFLRYDICYFEMILKNGQQYNSKPRKYPVDFPRELIEGEANEWANGVLEFRGIDPEEVDILQYSFEDDDDDDDYEDSEYEDADESNEE